MLYVRGSGLIVVAATGPENPVVVGGTNVVAGPVG
jgi:hypothetical protein